MYAYRKITDNLYWVGANDHRIALFENAYPVPDGVSYNSYLFTGEKSILFDTVHLEFADLLFQNLDELLGDKPLDYLIVNHMEPDHSGTLGKVIDRYPDVEIIFNKKTFTMFQRFFPGKEGNFRQVENDEVINLGGKEFRFIFAPMIHWPEVMMVYNQTDGWLFSADAFGTFGCLSGALFADELDFDVDILPDLRRYYCNIVGKYGMQVKKILDIAKTLDIKLILSLHGPVYRQGFDVLLSKYEKWATFEAEDDTAVIFYGTIYGNTEEAADILSYKLRENGVKGVKVFDVTKKDVNYLVAESYRAKTLVFAAPTHDAQIFPKMKFLIEEIMDRGQKNKSLAFIGNGTWAPSSQKLMPKMMETMKNAKVVGEPILIESTLKKDTYDALENLAREIAEDLKGN
ncbi:MAG: FprA family A-type flavoprotein [Lachnospiraceae bacterium]|jgi:flavorubredoxin|nr:FprA family A-type flavoprotein [Lachnospiraceae bacterium]